MKKKPSIVILSISWRNPYTEPPEGQPRVLWSKQYICKKVGDFGKAQREQKNEYNRRGLYPGCPWSICTTSITEPGTPWSKEAKARVRRGRLRKRLDNKMPLLADQFYQEELAKRSRYFAGEDEIDS
jgi:hypothetical protein